MKTCFPSVLLLLVVVTTQADDVEPDAVPEQPSIELLEFLADWEDTHGQWHDPQAFFDETAISLNEDGDDDDE